MAGADMTRVHPWHTPPGRQRFRRSEIPTCHPGRHGAHNKSDILLVSSTFADPGSPGTASQDAKCSTSRRRPAKKKSHDAMFFVKRFRRSEIPTCHPGRNGAHNKSDILLVSSTFADPGSPKTASQDAKCSTSRRRPAKKKSHDAMFFVKPFRRSEIPTCHLGRNGAHNKSDILLVSSTFADPRLPEE
jgi:hypothetical protein